MLLKIDIEEEIENINTMLNLMEAITQQDINMLQSLSVEVDNIIKNNK